MRNFGLSAVLFLCGVSLHLRAIPQNAARQEQTHFGVEGEFRHPVPLPSTALKALQASNDKNDLLEECAEDDGLQPSEVPASWFVASKIRLTTNPSLGLVVRGENQCLAGAHITQFWVLAKSATGEYRIVFRGRGDGMGVLPTRTNGYRDLQLVIVTQAGANVDEITFRYSKGSYRISSHLCHA
jgi:hypothetical protein